MAKSTIVEKNVPIEEHPYTLPDGWEWRRLGSLIENHDNKRVPISQKERQKRSGEYPYYGASGVIDYIDGYTHDGKFLLISEDGANLLARSKPIAFLASGKIWVNNHAHVVKFETDLLDEFFCYYLNNTDLSRYISGTAQPKLTQKKLVTIPVPYCLVTEKQKDIVSKIKSMLGKINEARELISEAKESFQNRRAAILEKAFRGELTAKWREQNPDVKDGTIVLSEITSSKKLWYEKQLLAAKENGLKKPGKLKEHKSPVSDEDLPEVPETWTWERLVNIAHVQGGVTKGRKFNGKETIFKPYLRVANVQDGYLDLDEVKEIEILPTDIEKYSLIQGDILFTEGGDRDKLGRGTIWKEEVPECLHQNHIFRARLYHQEMLPEFVSYATSTIHAKDYFFRNASQSVNLASINLTNLGGVPIPLPSIEEQKEIVRTVNKILSEENECLQIIELTEALNIIEKSILSSAFSGCLNSSNIEKESNLQLNFFNDLEKPRVS